MKPGDRNKAELRLILLLHFGERLMPECRFHPERRWRFDFAVPEFLVAFEYDGRGGNGSHVGRHASITGMAGDREKLNAAALLGWRVFSFTALHFDAKARAKHKLTSPAETIRKAALLTGFPDIQP